MAYLRKILTIKNLDAKFNLQNLNKILPLNYEIKFYRYFLAIL